MAGPHLSLTALTILLTVSGALFYGAIQLYGTWSNRLDGSRESLGKEGLHSVTDPDGYVQAREEEEQDGSKRG